MSGSAVGYGAALAAAGWLAARGVAAGRSERIARRLGLEDRRTPRAPLVPVPSWLRTRARTVSWSGHPWTYAGTVVGVAAAGAVLGVALAGPVGGFAGAAGGLMAVESLLRRRTARVRSQAEEYLREAILALAAAVRAGLSVRRAVEEAARHAGPPLDVELARVVDRLAVGETMDVALASLAARVDHRDVHLLVTVLAVHRRTGGDLPAMLEEVADVVGDRVRSRREVRTLTAQGRASGVVLSVLPVAFVALLSGTGGDALDAFYRTPLGAGLLASGLVCTALGFAWIRRIVRRAEMDR